MSPGVLLRIKSEGLLRRGGLGPSSRDPLRQCLFDADELRIVRQVGPLLGVAVMIVQFFAPVAVADVSFFVTTRVAAGIHAIDL